MSERLKLSFYGDDFTGSTDVMESLSFNGIPAALFLEVPDQEEVVRFRLKNKNVSPDGKLKAFGVPGIARSLTPRQMDEQLPAIFKGLSKIRTSYFHYKICSTFDSSPEIGNIGHAVEIALRFFPSTSIPLVVGIPLLNRFCVFGNLFARVDKSMYRLDEHPTMSKHPITPMREADLRKHLGKQTKRQVHLMDVLQLESKGRVSYYRNMAEKKGFVLFDVLRQKHLRQIGALIEKGRKHDHQLIVGSSGVEYALADHKGRREEGNTAEQAFKKADRYMVITGSCSPRTAEQLKYGIRVGFEPVALDTLRLIDHKEAEVQRCTEICLGFLADGKVPLLYSAMGPDDRVIEVTKKAFSNVGLGGSIGALLGSAQGTLLKNVIDKIGKLRVTVAGGDTSGYVTKTLKVHALEALAKIAPGAPLCIAHAKDPNYDGLEICLKGGQNGSERFFESVCLGVNEYHP